MAGFEVLTEAGYQPEVAVLRVPARAQAHRRPDVRGRHRQDALVGVRHREYGDYVSGPRIIDDSVKARMQEVLGDIKDGTFAARFIADQDAGAPEFKSLRAAGEAHPIEATGRELRGLMAWVKSSDDYTEGTAAR
jgi:ketol-acid reductoisomerase